MYEKVTEMDGVFVPSNSTEVQLFTLCHFDEFSSYLGAFPTRLAFSPEDYIVDVLVNGQRYSKIFTNLLYCLAGIYDPLSLSSINYDPEAKVVSFVRADLTAELSVADIMEKLTEPDGWCKSHADRYDGQVLAWELISNPILEPCPAFWV